MKIVLKEVLPRLKVAAVSTLLLVAVSARAVERQTLSGHIPAAVKRLQPVDRLSATHQLQLAIGLPLRNREALTNFLQQLYDPTSAQFRRYLTPGQFTERFGPTAQDYQAAVAFAQANGLTVTGTHPNRMLVDVQGTVADVERTFQVKMRVYAHPKEARTFYAPDAEPTIDLGLPVLHVSGLNDYTLPHPANLREMPFAQATGVRPQVGSGPNGEWMGKDFRAAYVPGTSLTGAGQVVGLFEVSGYYASDITAYKTQAGLPDVPLQNVLIDGFNGSAGARSGTANEEVAMDIEMVISMAPGLSQVLVYEGGPSGTTATVNDILNRMATDNLAKQLSCSWLFDINETTQQIFLQYAAQGQSFYQASGDSGAYAGAVVQPADNPNITVVGGTTLTTDSAQGWVSENTWSAGGGGISTIYPIPDWQRGLDMSVNQGSTTMRNLPDVAMVADNVWVMADRGRQVRLSGTSIGAPLWAGYTALINEQAAAQGQPPVGFINPAIYAVGKGSSSAQAFHDITTGNNVNSTSPTRFSAVAGYDLSTGWGTPNGTNLINALLDPQLEGLRVSPPVGFASDGPVGGPFHVTAQTYTLTNAGTAPLDWAASTTAAWLSVSPSSGTLTPGGTAAVVTVSLNSSATTLLIGAYPAEVSFTELNHGTSQGRRFRLDVGNSSFEMGDFTHWTFIGQTGVNFADSIDSNLLRGTNNIPGVDESEFVHTGIYGAFLGQNTTLGFLSQTLPTVPGQRYGVSFWLDNPAVGTPNEFQVRWNGTNLFDQVDLDKFGWTNFQYVVTASGTRSALQFGFRNDQNAFGLDDVSVQPVATPKIDWITQNQDNIRLSWSGLADLQYQVQYTADLNSANWSNLGGAVTATSGTVTMSDAVTSAPRRFYRIVLLP